MRKRVVITGMGWTTPLGHEIESVWKRLLAGESGIAHTTLFDARTFPTTFSAEVKDFDPVAALGASFARHKDANRGTKFALSAALQAWKMAGLAGPAGSGKLAGGHLLDPYSVGTYMGAGESGLDFPNFTRASLESWVDAPGGGGQGAMNFKTWGEKSLQSCHTMTEIEQDPSMTTAHLAMEFNARGPAVNCLTACAASTQALGEATEIIRNGDAEIMIAGGAHSMIHPFGVTGFNRLTALSTFNEDPQKSCRPFDAHRGGFVLGEGAGIVILESLEHAQARGATILAEIAGYGSSADAHAVTDQHPEGRGAIVAMTECLRDAQMSPGMIHYINAHGTGTKENDSTETMAIKGVFGPGAKHVPISSIKSMMGHLIAAAGAVELITCILAMRDSIIPPTANYSTPDPECDLDYVPNIPRKAKVDIAMSNSFGFGGQNDTLIVKRFSE